MKNAEAEYRTVLHAALRHALFHLENLEHGPVAALADAESLRIRLQKSLSMDGIAAAQVIADLASDVAGGLLGSAGGRFFAWVIGGSLPAALAADWLTSAWDQNAALFSCGPAAAMVEEIAGGWLKEILGIPSRASVAFVTGCQMAHATCLLAARHALLARRGWNVEERGLYGAAPLRILTSATQHGSFERAIRMLGLGLSNIVRLPVDPHERLSPKALERALDVDPLAPTITLLQAGEINTGSFDAFEELIPIARRRGAWVHIDGAFGLWAAASPNYRSLLAGAGAADSWATDGHKWLNVPYDCAYAFVADAEAHRAAMSHREPYLTHAAAARDQIDWNPEWSRRARGFSTYAALRQLGRSGIAELVERCCQHAHTLVTQIGRLRGAEMLWEPIINQGLVRFPYNAPGAPATDHDSHTDEVIAAINASGEAFFSGTTWRGRRAMRVSVCNWRTSDEDVQRSVSAVEEVLGRI